MTTASGPTERSASGLNALLDPGPVGPAGLTALLLLGDGRFPAGGHAHSAGVEAAVADGRIHDVDTLCAFVTGRLHTAGLVDAALAAATVLGVTGLHVPEPGATDSIRPPAPLVEPDGPTPVVGRGGPRAPLTGRGGGDTSGVAEVLCRLDREAAARIAAPPLRAASRRLGRQMLRVAARCWPAPVIDVASAVRPDGLHNPVALGVAAVAAGLSARSAAGLSVHHAVTTPAQAAVRLLGLDPFEVAALTAQFDRAAADVVDHGLASAEALASDADPGSAWVALPSLAAPLVEIAAVEHERADMRLFAT